MDKNIPLPSKNGKSSIDSLLSYPMRSNCIATSRQEASWKDFFTRPGKMKHWEKHF